MPPAAVTAAAAVAGALIALALAGCATPDGLARLVPGSQGVYVLGQNGASAACRDAAARAQALGTVASTGRVARCSVIGASLVCAEEEISCLGVERAQP